MANYEDLDVYRRSYETALRVHKVTEAHGVDDMVRQIRRATKSIPANIAEGFSKVNSRAEVKRFIGMALRSCDEVKVWLDFCRDLGYMAGEECESLKSEYREYGAMLYALWRRHDKA